MPENKPKIHPFQIVPDPSDAEAFDDYYSQEELEVCPLCFGAGMEVIPGKGARQCACRKQKNSSSLLDKARIPRRYAECHFHNYKVFNPSQDRAFRYASHLAMNYPAVERGAVFMGTVGVGKTHLAVSVIKGLTERGFPCLFYELGALIKEIQDSYNPNTKSSEFAVLSPILETEILVLDEIGATKPTDWMRDTLAHIINTRYNDKKLTIFTTNYLDERRNEREELLEDRIGVRLRSRIHEMCKTIIIAGQDYRLTFDRIAPVNKS